MSRGSTPGISAAIVAFDGVVADTFPLRAYALADALSAECLALSAVDVMPFLPGRSLREAAIEAMHRLPALEPFINDITLHDIVALRAQRSWSAAAAQGVPLREGVLPTLLQRVAAGTRVVLRSDSQRREVEPLLRLAGLEDSISFVRCSDDAPRVAGATTLVSSYEAIDQRLSRQQIARHERIAVEYDDAASALAAQFVASTQLRLK